MKQHQQMRLRMTNMSRPTTVLFKSQEKENFSNLRILYRSEVKVKE